jgi:glycosyltransferase involved in cell wall biosynthesis
MAGMTHRPRLLFLCQTLPYPTDAGVFLRTYHVLRMLSEAFQVTALCFERSKRLGAHDVDGSLGHLRRFGDVEAFPLPQQSSRLRFGYDHLRSLLLGRVYTTYLYESSAFKRRLRDRLESESFDIVHMDSLDLAAYLPDCGTVPVVAVHHNVESELMRRQSEVEQRWWTRAYLGHQARLMESVERRWCRRVAMNVLVSDRDGELLGRLAPGSRTMVVPNGIDVDSFTSSGEVSGTGIAYVGGTRPFPNLDALNFFCEQVLPRVRAVMPGTPVRWIGRATRNEQALYRERYGVELTGYVDDVRPLMREARCHVVPLRVGGGTRLKILSGWAVGKPVVSTSIGCEGLAVVDGINLLVRDDPETFAAAILDVLRDDALAARLGSSGRRTVEETYSWDVAARGMLAAYLRIGAQTRASSHAQAPARGPSVVQA